MSPGICTKCSVALRRAEKNIKCGWCEHIFHITCVNISEDDRDYIGNNANLVWYCDVCIQNKNTSNKTMLENILDTIKQLKASIDQQNEVISKQEKKISKLQESIKSSDDDLKLNIKNVLEVKDVIQETYSSKLKIKKPEPVIVIKPKDAKQPNTDTRKVIKDSFDPTKSGVSGIKNTRDGGIVLGCKNREAAEKLKAEAITKLGEKYNVIEPKKLLPRIKITGMNDRDTPEKLEKSILDQNEEYFIENKYFKIIYVGEQKNRRGFFAYAELNGESYRRILANRKINVGWDRCYVFDAVDITRCYKCSGFNHKAKECRNNLTCPKCGKSHTEDECTLEENSAECQNCKNVAHKLKLKIDCKHHSLSRECPTYLRKLELLKNKIDFL